MANDDHRPGEPSKIHLGPNEGGKKFNWLPWLLAALGLLLLIFTLARCSNRDDAVAPVVTETEAVTNTTTTTTTSNLALPGGAVLAVTESTRPPSVAPQAIVAGVPSAPAPSPAAAGPGVAAPIGDPEIELAVVKSPIVGTFYRAPEPGAADFVEIGTTVKKGQVLCIIEAMKLMNEIDSEYDGEIVNVYVENGAPVQYGERLFAIRTK